VATLTDFLLLSKPEGADNVDFNDLNANYDLLDEVWNAAIGGGAQTDGSLPDITANTGGTIMWGTTWIDVTLANPSTVFPMLMLGFITIPEFAVALEPGAHFYVSIVPVDEFGAPSFFESKLWEASNPSNTSDVMLLHYAELTKVIIGGALPQGTPPDEITNRFRLRVMLEDATTLSYVTTPGGKGLSIIMGGLMRPVGNLI
jgi:hypothetical protein